jgi:hypothetical protein
MDNDTHETSDTAPATSAPRGCDECTMGVSIVDGNEILACAICARSGRGHRGDRDVVELVMESLAALADVRECLWTVNEPDAEWSPDTIDEIAPRLAVLRTTPDDAPRGDAIRYGGSVRIELTYEDSDGCYDGKVVVDGLTYSVSVGPPASGYGPGVAYDLPEAYDRAAHAALSFAAADTPWGEGCDIFTPAADLDANAWVIRRCP